MRVPVPQKYCFGDAYWRWRIVIHKWEILSCCCLVGTRGRPALVEGLNSWRVCLTSRTWLRPWGVPSTRCMHAYMHACIPPLATHQHRLPTHLYHPLPPTQPQHLPIHPHHLPVHSHHLPVHSHHPSPLAQGCAQVHPCNYARMHTRMYACSRIRNYARVCRIVGFKTSSVARLLGTVLVIEAFTAWAWWTSMLNIGYQLHAREHFTVNVVRGYRSSNC